MRILDSEAAEELAFRQWEEEVAQLEKARQEVWRKLVVVVLAAGGTVRVPEMLPLLHAKWDVDKMELVEYRDPATGDFVFAVRESSEGK